MAHSVEYSLYCCCRYRFCCCYFRHLWTDNAYKFNLDCDSLLIALNRIWTKWSIKWFISFVLGYILFAILFRTIINSSLFPFFAISILDLNPDRTCRCLMLLVLLLSYSIYEHHMHKNKSTSNYCAFVDNPNTFYLNLGLWNENCLTNQKWLRYRILLDTNKSIFDLSLSLSSFSHFRVTPPKKSIRIRIKIQWQRNWWSKKPSAELTKRCPNLLNEFRKLEAAEKKKWKIHRLCGEWWWWICHFIASFFFSLYFLIIVSINVLLFTLLFSIDLDIIFFLLLSLSFFLTIIIYWSQSKLQTTYVCVPEWMSMYGVKLFYAAQKNLRSIQQRLVFYSNEAKTKCDENQKCLLDYLC